MIHDIPFHQIDLRALAERQGPERAFLSLYLANPDSLNSLERRIRKVRGLLSENPVELEYFEENLRLVRELLESSTFTSGSLCIFACWALDYVEGFRLEKEVPDVLWVHSSPYIRPLAELQDEYETFVVVAADNTAAQVYVVTSAVPDEEARMKGDVKNRVKVGGWSQKRYERRRDKELLQYARDVAASLADLDGREPFDRLILIGSEETMLAIESELNGSLKQKLAGKESVDLSDQNQMWDEAFALFFQEERAAEETLWQRIRSEYLQGGRAALGPEDVLKAAGIGQIEKMIVTRDAKVPGIRCRDCENLGAEASETCPVCGSEEVFKIDLINELVELLAVTSAETEFADPIEGLSQSGDVAALLRY